MSDSNDVVSDKVAPGEARASGPSVADTLKQDAVAPPPPLLEQNYQFLGDEDIPCSRYTSREFFDREIQDLWPRAWQWACREEHLPDVGDNHVYQVGPWSVIVVRSAQDTIQAFMNSCTHRGTRILGNEGSGFSQGFTCPFHGWSWHLDGSIDTIPGRWDFPHVGEESHSLREVRCDTWGGFVFINMDADAAPLDDYLGVMKQHFSHFPLERRRIAVHVQKILPANWKAAQEAFMEAYHNFETHDSPNGGNTQYDVFSKYVSRFIHNIGSYSPESLDDYPGDKWRRPPLSEEEQLASMGILAQADVGALADGSSARKVIAQAMREQRGAELGIDLSQCSDTVLMDSIEYHLFPNMFFFPGIAVPMVYRFRPHGDDVDSSIFDLMVLEPLPDGAPHPEPPEPVRLDVEQSYTEVAELAWLAPVYDQDTSNLQMQQDGFKTSGKAGITLGNYQESRIRRLHMTLIEFLSSDGQSIKQP